MTSKRERFLHYYVCVNAHTNVIVFLQFLRYIQNIIPSNIIYYCENFVRIIIIIEINISIRIICTKRCDTTINTLRCYGEYFIKSTYGTTVLQYHCIYMLPAVFDSRFAIYSNIMFDVSAFTCTGIEIIAP